MITVRPTAASDVEALCRLQKAAFKPLYERYHDAGNPFLRGEEDISGRLDSPSSKYYTILDSGKIVGGALYRCGGRTPFVKSLREGEAYLARIYVDPALQGRGIGREAILLCEKELGDVVRIYVDFPRELEKNRRCYESAGFRSTGRELEAEPGLVLVAYEKTI